MIKKFFPPRPDANPTIYAYELVGMSTHTGLLKVGYAPSYANENANE